MSVSLVRENLRGLRENLKHKIRPLAASRVPVEAPFKCPLCSNFAENYGGMLKHFLIFHQQLTPMAEQLSKPDQPFVPPLVRHT
jgi:hypothetical protein